MPRLPRIYIANCVYYISAHGNVGERIFLDEKDYHMYMELLKKYRQQYSFKLFSFALLPNSLSLLVELKEGSTISMMMHDINSSYTKYFNGRYNRKGHVFGQRFKSVVVEKESFALNVIRYIHLNPVREGLVKEPGEYGFSSQNAYQAFGGGQSSHIPFALDLSREVKEILDFIGTVLPEKKTYADFMVSVTKNELDDLSKRLAASGVLGTSAFIQSVEDEFKRRQEQITRREGSKIPFVTLTLVILIGGALAGVITYQNSQKAVPMVNVPQHVEPVSTAALTDLNGTEWVLELSPEKGVNEKYPEFDRLILRNGSLVSSYFAGKGYPTSNYDLVGGVEGILVWETMQRGPVGEVIYWHAEVIDGKMTGKFSKRLPDGSFERVAFKSPGYYKISEK